MRLWFSWLVQAVEKLNVTFKLQYRIIALLSLLFAFLVAWLQHDYDAHGYDLLYWKEEWINMQLKPMKCLWFILGMKIGIIPSLAFFTWWHAPIIEKNNVQIRQRYRQFLVMRLLAALDGLLQVHDYRQSRCTERCQLYMQRHTELIQAIEQFRSDTRRIFERNDEQLRLSLEQLLVVDPQLEAELLQQDYGAQLSQLKEIDMFNLLFGSQPTYNG